MAVMPPRRDLGSAPIKNKKGGADAPPAIWFEVSVR
jgi:hypothetical protein